MDKITVSFEIKTKIGYKGEDMFEFHLLDKIDITDNKPSAGNIVVEKDSEGFFTIKLPEYIDCISSEENTIISNYSKYKDISIKLILNPQLKEICHNSFYYDRTIKKVICNQNLTLIGTNAFRDSSIEEIIFPKDCSLKYLNDYCFESSNIKSFIVPKNLKTISSNAFANSKLNNIDFSAAQNLRKIAQRAFFNTPIKSIQLPSNLSKIGSCAFAQCEKLESIVFSEDPNINKISSHAFYQCIKLNKFQLNYKKDKLLSLGDSVFEGCTDLEKIDGFNTWKFIKLPNYFFANSNMSQLTKLPFSVRYLGDFSFSRSQAINLKLTDDIISIGDGCFYKVKFKEKNFNHFVSGSSITSIGHSAFLDCGFEKIDTSFFTHLEKLGSFAFSFNNFKNLHVYPLSPRIKSNYIFGMSRHLTKVEFKNCCFRNEYTVRSWMFYGCVLLKTIKLSDSIRTIKRGAFSYCGVIENLITNPELKTIEKEAFKGTKVENLDLSKTRVTSFPTKVFPENFLFQSKINPFTTSIKSSAFLRLSETDLELYPFIQ